MSEHYDLRVAGVSFIEGYPDNLRVIAVAVNARSASGADPLPCELRRNPENPYDVNAIEVHVVGKRRRMMVGHLAADLAAQLAPRIDSGEEWTGHVRAVLFAPENPDRPGIEVRIEPHHTAIGGTKMGTPLNTGTKSLAPPAIKLRNVGDSVRFAVVDLALDLPATEIGTRSVKKREDGTVITQHALTVLVTDPGQAVKVEGEAYVPFAAGEVGTIYIGSYAKYDPDRDKVTVPYKSWGGVTDDVGLEVGFVGEWKFLEELPPTRVGNNGRKDRKFRLRADKPEEAAQSARCEELRKELQRQAGERTELVAAGAPAPAYEVEDF